MDPNATLKELRAMVQDALRIINSENADRCGYSDMLNDIAVHVDRLDYWISHGGFLPNDWNRPDLDITVPPWGGGAVS
jgi:hypothetical protein